MNSIGSIKNPTNPMKKKILWTLLAMTAVAASGQDTVKSITADQLLTLKGVSDLQISPHERWIAYTVSSADTAKDKTFSQIWMVPADGGDPVPMTSRESSASRPRWSPDGKYLSFLAAKGENAKAQVWNLNRLGGEAIQVTRIKQGVSAYDWSPDGTRMLLVLKDPKPSELTKDTKDDKKPLPHVIDRLFFKEDNEGYLDRRRDHLYVFTPGDTAAIQITSGDYDDSNPRWSPDGRSIVFVSNRSENPDLSYDSNLWIVRADNGDKGASIRQLTTGPVSDESPEWSPDGSSIAYVTTLDERFMPFSMEYLALIPAEGGSPQLLARDLDRRVFSPKFSPDGKMICFGMEDRGKRVLASVPTGGGKPVPLVNGNLSVSDYKVGTRGIYTIHEYSDRPSEIYRWEDQSPQKLTTVNDSLLAHMRLEPYEKVRFNSKDGTPVEGFVIKPAPFHPSVKHPLVLWIHGGPIGQYTYDVHATGQFFAANGYVVLLVNPRGSTGYGEEFCKAIFADWGNKDYDDVMAGVDHLIGLGYVDEERLGVGGWSYGGILTNYVITRTTRFKAAISGASLGILMSNFGHDQYIKWYNAEFGMPWENRDVWERLSPFNDVEKITTPTLWIGGDVDWNVPITNSEQMYQGMKALGKETQLVVYPGEHHSIRRPSFQKDRYERFVAWFDKYLK